MNDFLIKYTLCGLVSLACSLACLKLKVIIIDDIRNASLSNGIDFFAFCFIAAVLWPLGLLYLAIYSMARLIFWWFSLMSNFMEWLSK